MKRVRKYLVEFFGFSQAESKGFIIFLGFIILFSTLSIQMPSFLFRNEFDKKANSEKIALFLKGIQSKSTKTDLSIKKKVKVSDPNTMNIFDWKKIGLSEHLTNNIISYRLHGGFFQEKTDLKKIYGFSDSVYLTVEPYLRIKKSEKPLTRYATTNSGNKNLNDNKAYRSKSLINKPDLNSCDSTDLLFIKGIGPARASRIIKYRSKLGGFNNITQVSEVYGLDSLVLENLLKNTTLIEDTALKKMNLNLISFKDLLKHPYVDYNTCKVIINFRNQHGEFRSIENLKQIKIINAEFISKIEPYITFQ